MDKACAYGLANTIYSVVATIDPARVAQSAERKTLNLVVEGSSPLSGIYIFFGSFSGVFGFSSTDAQDEAREYESKKRVVS